MEINWKDTVHPLNSDLYFKHLKLNENFKIVVGDAVYTKVAVVHKYDENQEFMCELATGKLFPPTKSAVKLVDVEVNVNIPRPVIY